MCIKIENGNNHPPQKKIYTEAINHRKKFRKTKATESYKQQKMKTMLKRPKQKLSKERFRDNMANMNKLKFLGPDNYIWIS